ncbi:MAG: hypothetical protein WD187_03805 [Candidatus Woykebacteria bacterium]
MAEGPVVHRRIQAGGPPSDLPDKALYYPGKPLSHRYQPTEKTRRFEVPRPSDQPKLAGVSSLPPIASVRYPDKDVYLSPVSNMRPRNLQPLATSGRVTVPGPGAATHEISEELRQPLEKRVARLVDQSKNPSRPPPQETVKLATDTETAQPAAPREQIVTELENLKKSAAQELAKRSGQQIAPSNTTTPAPSVPVPTKPTTTAEPAPSTPLSANTPAPTVTDEGTKQLLSQAEQLESELSKLRQGIIEKREESEKERVKIKQTEEQHEAQIQQLVGDRASLSKRINELTAAHSEELNQRKELESNIEGLTADYEQRLSRLRTEKDELAAARAREAERVQELQNSTNELSKNFEEKLGEIQTEKARLLAQINTLAESQKSLQEQQSLNASQAAGNTRLKEELENTQRELSATAEQNKNLEATAQELRTNFNTLNSETAKLKSDLEATQKNSAQIGGQVGQLTSQAQELKKELAAKDQENLRLRGELEGTQKRSSEISGKNSSLESLIQRLQQEITKQRPQPQVQETKPPPPPLAPDGSVTTTGAKQEERSAVRVVRPTPAVGKMAPSLTSAPNVINGIVKASDGSLLSNVIIVVKDGSGQPVRALKTNKIGQFAISTPLPNSTYTMDIESPGHTFDVIEVGVTGHVLPPIEIKATS